MQVSFDSFKARKDVLQFFPADARGAVSRALSAQDVEGMASLVSFFLDGSFADEELFEGDVWEAIASYWDAVGDPVWEP